MLSKNSQTVVLLVNLGSPDVLTVSAIAKFLSKFLSDKRVVSLKKIFWYPILYGIILPFRSRSLLNKYKEIWHIESNLSPLVYYTKNQALSLKERLETNPNILTVDYAFCYSNPSIGNSLGKLHKEYTIKNLVIIPLYPQFSATTTMAVFDSVAKFYSDKPYLPELHFIRGFATNLFYIKAVGNSILASFKDYGKPNKLILSYHSLPQNLIDKGDSYYEECLNTSSLLLKYLGLDEQECVTAFQSKFGSQKWLTPATANVIIELAKKNVESIAIVCPGFMSDCLETLEEINVTNRKLFLSNGGKSYRYISCLNATVGAIDMLDNLIKG